MNRIFFKSSSSSNHGLQIVDLIAPDANPLEKVWINFFAVKHSIISSVPLPWCTSKSTIAIFLLFESLLLLYLFPVHIKKICPCNCHIVKITEPISRMFALWMMSILERIAYSTAPKGPAWCPGGLTAQKAFLCTPSIIRSTDCTTAPAAIRLDFHEAFDIAESLSKWNYLTKLPHLLIPSS